LREEIQRFEVLTRICLAPAWRDADAKPQAAGSSHAARSPIGPRRRLTADSSVGAVNVITEPEGTLADTDWLIVTDVGLTPVNVVPEGILVPLTDIPGIRRFAETNGSVGPDGVAALVGSDTGAATGLMPIGGAEEPVAEESAPGPDDITAEVEVGRIYEGTVLRLLDFGAIVQVLPGKDGLLHISKLRGLAGGRRVEAVEDVVSVGQKIQVQIAEIDDRGKLSLIPVIEGEDGDKKAEAESAE
jgi:predicted RNA-binding protein with RPS1 domain